jgi:benzoate/toluate 1,2-dioxygenase subunit beta
MAVDRQSLEAFLYLEARLADEHRYDDWEALWADDGLYWVPSGKDDSDPSFEASIIYDNRRRINTRLNQLRTGLHWPQDPPSRMRRVISNIEVIEQDDELVTVEYNFFLVEIRTHLQTTWAGRTRMTVRSDGDSWLIKLKKVMLVNNNEVMPHLTMIV